MLHLVAANLAFSLGKLLGRRNGDHGIHRSGSGLEPILNVRRNSEFCVREKYGCGNGPTLQAQKRELREPLPQPADHKGKAKANAHKLLCRIPMPSPFSTGHLTHGSVRLFH